MYKNLLFVKHYQGNVEDLALDFTLTINGTFISMSFFYFPT